ncbi:MAG: discoidin domain-containing protein [Bacteroidota bacterium]
MQTQLIKTYRTRGLVPSSFKLCCLLLTLTLFFSCTEDQEVIPNDQFEPESTSDLTGKTQTNARIGKLSISRVTAKSHDGNVPQNTVDGNFSTRWSANGSGQYITFDLGSSKSVSNIKVAWYKGNQRRASFKIRVGNSTSSMSTIYTGNSSGNTNSLENYDFSDVTSVYS